MFVDSNIDTADNLYQEFVRIRPNRESDREAIITGNYNDIHQTIVHIQCISYARLSVIENFCQRYTI